jgi:hypothetical protein
MISGQVFCRRREWEGRESVRLGEQWEIRVSQWLVDDQCTLRRR